MRDKEFWTPAAMQTPIAKTGLRHVNILKWPVFSVRTVAHVAKFLQPELIA